MLFDLAPCTRTRRDAAVGWPAEAAPLCPDGQRLIAPLRCAGADDQRHSRLA
jgi:hypothetical protein